MNVRSSFVMFSFVSFQFPFLKSDVEAGACTDTSLFISGLQQVALTFVPRPCIALTEESLRKSMRDEPSLHHCLLSESI